MSTTNAKSKEKTNGKSDEQKEKSWMVISKPRLVRPLVQQYCGIEDLPPIPISFPQKGAIGRTGDWRTYKPVVDQAKCTRCGQCYLFCPEGTIEWDESGNKFVVDYDYCKGCGICAKGCPLHIIQMILEER